MRPADPGSASMPAHPTPTTTVHAAALPANVLSPLIQLLSYLAWCVLLLCIARTIWVGGLLWIRVYREESIEGLAGALLGATLLAMASSLALAVLPPT